MCSGRTGSGRYAPSTAFSSIQKPCSKGERECATGQPMIPASRVVPVIFTIKCSQPSQDAEGRTRA